MFAKSLCLDLYLPLIKCLHLTILSAFWKSQAQQNNSFRNIKKLVAVYYCLICDVISQTFTSSLISHKEELLLRNRVSEGMKEAETAVTAILHYTINVQKTDFSARNSLGIIGKTYFRIRLEIVCRLTINTPICKRRLPLLLNLFTCR